VRRAWSLRLALALAMTLVPLVALPNAASAATDHSVTVTDAAPTASWDGTSATGFNQTYDSTTGGPCGKTEDTYCDTALVHVDVTSPQNVEIGVVDFDVPTSDFDLFVYESDASGTRGDFVDDSASFAAIEEFVTIPGASGFYLVHVVYFQVFPESGYRGTVEILAGEPPPPPPPTNDLPLTDFYFHDDGPPPTDGSFDTSFPTTTTPTVAPGSAIGPPASWTGNTDPGRVNTLRVDFWQQAPVGQVLLNDVVYEVTVSAGGRTISFPDFREPAPPDDGPSRVVHTFTPEDTGSPLPIGFPDGEVTITIQGHFIDTQAFTSIWYDSVDFASRFSVNVPRPVTRAPFPPDVDDPPGLQEALASDPSLGFTSRSEPHIAQNPLDPDMLIAGSKFYNRDPDALNEYEFKIGTYVSFDGGQTWTDLGQLAVCPISEAPPETWPHQPCYPEDDPNAEGPEEGGDDLAEEYITSDVWVNFDDEGNAYVMVLDHPPFDGEGEGYGWGMTLHRWDSVSPGDLAPGGETWSDRIPINAYDNSLTQAVLLDDKNTFAVNNAGGDRDDESGIMIACWGLSTVLPQPLPGAGKQQIVCERSTDGGLSWPDPPQPISDGEALVIGVDVVADTRDPETFYATWLQYATGGGAGDIGGTLTPETLEFAVTTDGGVTWVHRQVPITTVSGVPRQFPGQAFRNLSIPIMAVGPDGDIYITWADYLPAPDPVTDEDDLQADIKIVKSTDGGVTWDDPVNITDDTGPGTNVNADQFQPYIAVTGSGQVNVAYFDRRLDLRTDTHSGNYFTDVFLSRSNDDGQSWADVRLTHDATDPEFNAPVSSSGLFFGDYQGLVADDCFAIPFFNDTHLANDDFLDPGPVRDPEFDDGYPSSPYQESVAWRVPNTPANGGPESGAEGCPADLSVTKTDSPDPAHVGQSLTYTITVTNDGPGIARDVTAVDQLPKSTGFGSASASQGACSRKKTSVTCSLGDLASGQSATITILVKPTKKGTILNSVTVTSPSDDPNAANNTDTEGTQVLP
jgi:uncharacterized repeat protein (TIGR01451 family)